MSPGEVFLPQAPHNMTLGSRESAWPGQRCAKRRQGRPGEGAAAEGTAVEGRAGEAGQDVHSQAEEPSRVPLTPPAKQATQWCVRASVRPGPDDPPVGEEQGSLSGWGVGPRQERGQQNRYGSGSAATPRRPPLLPVSPLESEHDCLTQSHQKEMRYSPAVLEDPSGTFL